MSAAAAFARLGELELYYEMLGAGPPLVLIHGSLMTAGLLKEDPALLAAGLQVITVELQGHGHTRDIGRPLRYELLADDIAALLDHLGLARADLVGYSLGARRGRAGRDPASRPGPAPGRDIRHVPQRRPAPGDDRRGGRGQRRGAALGQHLPPGLRGCRAGPGGLAGLVRKVLDLDAQPQDWPAAQVAAIEAPVMLVVADSDIVRLEHAVEMFHLLGGGIAGDIHGLPASRLAVVPGTTHTGLCDRAAWVVPMLTEFLGDAGGPVTRG